jgi:hypothetical protein
VTSYTVTSYTVTSYTVTAKEDASPDVVQRVGLVVRTTFIKQVFV